MEDNKLVALYDSLKTAGPRGGRGGLGIGQGVRGAKGVARETDLPDNALYRCFVREGEGISNHQTFTEPEAAIPEQPVSSTPSFATTAWKKSLKKLLKASEGNSMKLSVLTKAVGAALSSSSDAVAEDSKAFRKWLKAEVVACDKFTVEGKVVTLRSSSTSVPSQKRKRQESIPTEASDKKTANSSVEVGQASSDAKSAKSKKAKKQKLASKSDKKAKEKKPNKEAMEKKAKKAKKDKKSK